MSPEVLLLYLRSLYMNKTSAKHFCHIACIHFRKDNGNQDVIELLICLLFIRLRVQVFIYMLSVLDLL